MLIQIDEIFSNFLLFANKIATICLQKFAKLQLLQKYSALFENCFWQSFKFNDCQKNFTMLQSRKTAFTPGITALEIKHLVRPTEHYNLNTVANMVAKIDIDALKI